MGRSGTNHREAVRASFHEEAVKRQILDDLNTIAPLDRTLSQDLARVFDGA